jgi:biopolymer transport protein ExbD
MLMKKRKREEAEINGSSMADIAFLLLIFFLVTTTINVDTGIGLMLPPPLEDEDPPPIRERNLMNILVNERGQILMDDEPYQIGEVKNYLIEFIRNPTNDPDLAESPELAIISIRTQRQTPYRIYIDMLDEVMGAYKELRDQASSSNFGVPYNALGENSAQQEQIKDMYPKKISIAEGGDN